jgi:Protein of unknown function (DUF3307)
MIEPIWLTKIILAHLITDFLLQPTSWIEERSKKHFASPMLYVHGLVTAIVAFAITGFVFWKVALFIFVTHILIDGWKSYQTESFSYFIKDQLLHLLVIVGCWYFTFISFEKAQVAWQLLNTNLHIWKVITAFVFVTMPAGIVIGKFTKQWQDEIGNADSLANAGKWIGIIERVIVLIFVLKGDYAAISLLLAAKGIIRFNEKDRPEIKTEYLVIGTLLSICIAIIAGLLVKL